MATTAPQLNPEPVPIGHHSSRVEELIDVIAHYTPRFRRIALEHLGDVADAEDAIQDALLSALTHVDQFKGNAKMSTWLTSIVINSSRQTLRKRVGQVNLAWDQSNGMELALAEIIPDTRPGPEEEFRKREIGDALATAISRLSPILFTTFQLRDIHGFSIRETARVLGVQPETVKVRLLRARARLKEMMGRSTRKYSSRLSSVGIPASPARKWQGANAQQ